MSNLIPQGAILSLWAESADRLLQANQGDAALLFLHILRHNNLYHPLWDFLRVKEATVKLEELGLLPEDLVKPWEEEGQKQLRQAQAPTTLSMADVSIAMADQRSPFRGMVDAIEHQLGKTLTNPDLVDLISIYEEYALPVDVILMLVTYCIEKQKLSTKQNRRMKMSTVKKEAERWDQLQITTVKAAMDYTQRLVNLCQSQAQVVEALQLADPSFSAQAQGYLQQWNDWGFSLDVYPVALEICKDRVNFQENSLDFPWPYCHGIFTKWHRKNLHTLAEVRNDARVSSQNRHGKQSMKKNPRGPYVNVTMQGTATTAPPPEQVRQMQEDYDYLTDILAQFPPD